MINRITVIIILIVGLQLQYCMAQGSWHIIDIPTQQNLNSVFFSDSLKGWAVGDSGLIIHTTDGGQSWVFQESNSVNELVDVFFLDKQQGWISSINFTNPPYGTILLKTIDGGQNWTSHPYPEENIFINCILFLDSLNGWMGGSPHALVHTTDGGQQWQQAAIDTSTLAFFPVLSIQFHGTQYGYACGGIFDIAGVTWHTNNGGELWHAIDVSEAPADEVHEMHLFDSLHIMGAGGDPDFGYGVGLIRTSDGGFHWDYDEIGIQGNAHDLDFVDSKEVWAPLGPRRKFIYSIDTGQTWIDIPTPESTAIFDVFFSDSLHGYAVGDDGAMLRVEAAGTIGFPTHSVNANAYLLHQNHPNPFNQSTKIEFSIPNNQMTAMTIEIKVFDVYGNTIRTLVNKKLGSGSYQTTFEAEDLENGIYFCQYKVGNQVVAVKRMVLVHQ